MDCFAENRTKMKRPRIAKKVNTEWAVKEKKEPENPEVREKALEIEIKSMFKANNKIDYR